jgi:hypothetical protein
MNKQLINVTLSVVTEEIEHILETYPKYPYQQAFSAFELRQDLIAQDLRRYAICSGIGSDTLNLKKQTT